MRETNGQASWLLLVEHSHHVCVRYAIISFFFMYHPVMSACNHNNNATACCVIVSFGESNGNINIKTIHLAAVYDYTSK